MKCPASPRKRRVSKPHGSHSHGSTLNAYKNGIRGHHWIGHGKNRKCDNCNCKPRHLRGR